MSPTELAHRESAALAAKQVTDMFGGDTGVQIPIDAPLPQIKILRETPQYEMPDGTLVKSFNANILYWHNANQYYNVEFGEGESGPPKCASSDGIKPDGGTDPCTWACRDCPYNQYNSDPKGGKGKACANTIRLYLLVEGDILPCIMKAPPSSLGNKDMLIRWLTNAPNVAAKAGVGTKYQPIVCKFGLHTKTFDQFSASIIDIETVGVLTPTENMKELQVLGRMFQDFMANYVKRIRRDVGAEHDGEPAPDDAEYAGEPAQGNDFQPDDSIPI